MKIYLRKNNDKYLLITDHRDLEKYLPLFDIAGRKVSKPVKTGIYLYKGQNGITKILFVR